MNSPCFLLETRELTRGIEEEGCQNWKASHAGIIRIGFEGISQPHIVEHPCFNIFIGTLDGWICKLPRWPDGESMEQRAGEGGNFGRLFSKLAPAAR
jgi:hypothetical protein